MNWLIKLSQNRFRHLIGLAGVRPPESLFARRVNLFFSWMMLTIALVLLVQWQWALTGALTNGWDAFFNWIIVVFFILVYSIDLTLVEDRRRFVIENWSIPLILVLSIPLLFHWEPLSLWIAALRPLLALYITLPTIRRVLSFFFDGHLRTTILGAAIVIIIFGALVAGLDPGVKSIWDGIWWALATVTTIGYGDVVPTSAVGRLLGMILVILGLGIFVIITANILAFVLRRERRTLVKEERELNEVLDEIKHIKQTQQRQMQLIERLLNRKRDD